MNIKIKNKQWSFGMGGGSIKEDIVAPFITNFVASLKS